MKNKISILSAILLLASSFANAEVPADAPEDAPFVAELNQAVGFGIWRIYNDGINVYITDEQDKRFLKVEPTGNTPNFWDGDLFKVLHGNGAIDGFELDIDHRYFVEASEGLAVPISKQLAEGIYSFGVKRFEVKGDTLAVYNWGDENPEELPRPSVIIRKYSNGLFSNGIDMQQTIEPSIVLDANGASVPPLVKGDCLATYSPETGLVDIPCVKLLGGSNNAINRVKQHQIPGSLTFEVNENTDVTRAQ